MAAPSAVADAVITRRTPMVAGRPGHEAIFLLESPLWCLFAEEKHGDRQAREALFCTFNADLGYFVYGCASLWFIRSRPVGPIGCWWPAVPFAGRPVRL
jgi:hypothetical protein